MTGSRAATAQAAASEFDLTRFREAFLEEADEHLQEMEALLLALDTASADRERLDAIFRCAHSVKGGAATFGLHVLAELTHAMEGLLDRLRRGEAVPDATMTDALLEAGDLARELIAGRRARGGDDEAGGGDNDEAVRGVTQSCARLVALANGRASQAGASSTRTLRITIGPLARPDVANDVASLFDEIPGLGLIHALDGGGPDARGVRLFEALTSSSDDDLLDLFSLHVAREQVAIVEIEDAAVSERVAQSTPPAGAPSLRVPVAKIDALIELASELVIGQSTLGQAVHECNAVPSDRLVACIDQLERSTRQLQQAVMAVRMVPLQTVFMRLPRMVHELAKRLGKQVDLHTAGELTELDKGMVEQILDPLSHLVRNAIDHGIEPARERLARGKPARGSLRVAAWQQYGSITLEVSDDGRGLEREAILVKAREAGLDLGSSMSDHEVYQLLFAPGLTTAAEATEVSGRGVGLDVVRRNILALGGSVALGSQPGHGTRFTAHLPLTMAILDGMSVAVGDETYIIPAGAVVESFRLADRPIRSGTSGTSGAGGDRAVLVRGEYVPLLVLQAIFAVDAGARRAADPIVVVVESDGARVAVLVDELLGQPQVVVKNIETNYRRVPAVAGATILGNGAVALIVDVAYLVRRSHQ